jgi:iron complex transport system permease protein
VSAASSQALSHKITVTRRPAFATVLTVAVLLFLASFVVGVVVGAVHISPREIFAVFTGSQPVSAEYRTILLYIRLPRVITAAVIGASLSLAGVLFQGLFRNPLADSYVLGSSGGAAFGAALGMVLFPGSTLLGFGGAAVFAFLGATLTIMLVYMVARVSGRVSTVALLLCGFAISMMLNEASTVIVYLGNEYSVNARNLALWLHGSIAFSEWSQLIWPGLMLLVGAILSFPLRRILNVFALGEDYARQLGVNIELARALLVGVGSLLTASAVLLGGIIGFVGLLVPHVIRLIAGPEHGRLLGLSAICGATYLILADSFARTVVAPTELPVGVVTAFLGGPVLIYLLRRLKQEYVV